MEPFLISAIIVLIVVICINHVQNTNEKSKLIRLYNEEIDSHLKIKSAYGKYAFEAEDYRNKYFAKNLENSDLQEKITVQENKIKNLEEFILKKRLSVVQEKETSYPYEAKPTFNWEKK